MQHLKANRSYGEIAARLGVSKQAAQQCATLALGKLVYGLKKMEGIGGS